MSYELLIHREAEKELSGLPNDVYRRIYRNLLSLKQHPRPRNSTKLKGRDDLWRLRVGRYRLIYQIDDDRRVITVLRVALRNERTYRGL